MHQVATGCKVPCQSSQARVKDLLTALRHLAFEFVGVRMGITEYHTRQGCYTHKAVSTSRNYTEPGGYESFVKVKRSLN